MARWKRGEIGRELKEEMQEKRVSFLPWSTDVQGCACGKGSQSVICPDLESRSESCS